MFQKENSPKTPVSTTLYFLSSFDRHISLSDMGEIENNAGFNTLKHHFVRSSDRDSFFRRRIFLYRVLNDYFSQNGYKPLGKGDILERGSMGKPSLRRADGSVYAGFNISFRSHSIIVGLSPQHSIGVDVEDIERPLRPNSMEAVMDYYFGEDEKAYVLKTSNGRNLRFLELWTRKEAAVKALGQSIGSYGSRVRGLSLPWINREEGGPVMGVSFFMPGSNKLLLSVALKTNSEITEGNIVKKNARRLFGGHN